MMPNSLFIQERTMANGATAVIAIPTLLIMHSLHVRIATNTIRVILTMDMKELADILTTVMLVFRATLQALPKEVLITANQVSH
jgi:hypothetical protein